MNTHLPRAARSGLVGLGAIAALGLASVGTAIAAPTGVVYPHPDASSWKQYLLTPAAQPKPVRVVSTSGRVQNAQALVTGSGAATLTSTAAHPRPIIVLDYGEELGGNPSYRVSRVSAGPMTIHVAYSESLSYLFTPGSTTLALDAPQGADALHVASVTNFVVGDQLTVNNGSSAQQVMVTKVGSVPLATTTSLGAAAGSSTINVASVGDLIAGDPLTVGSTDYTIASVGTASASTTLSAAAAQGATTITVGSATGVTAGDTITVGSDRATVASVAPGFGSATVTLTAGLTDAQAQGATVFDAGSGITLTSALTSPVPAGTSVTSDGSGLSIRPSLTAAQTSGTAVTSSPGAATGDYTATGAGDAANVSVTGTGTYSSPRVGGFRYQEIELDSPGTISLTRSGISYNAYRATPNDYQGHFESSDQSLNKMFYDGAYTTQMDMFSSAITGNSYDELVDGAKRDERIWSGDLLQEIPTLESTLGTNAASYIKGDLTALTALSSPSGELGNVGGFGSYSLSYSIDTALAAIEYYRYSGDTAFAQSELPALRNELNFLASQVDGNGLLVTSGGLGAAAGGSDWSFDNGSETGEVSYFNMLYYRLLTQMNYIESQAGSATDASSDQAAAAKLRSAINQRLYNSTTQSYEFTNLLPSVIPEDADVAAVLYGVAPAARDRKLLATVKSRLWLPLGVQPWSSNDPNLTFKVLSPYIEGFEVDARFATGDVADALTLLQHTWGHMMDSPDFTGTYWEEMYYDGTLTGAHDSLAHGWSSGPTNALTQYVLGAQPVDPGYATWSVAPHVFGSGWAKGQTPTASTPLGVNWNNTGQSFKLVVTAPAKTSGTIVLPDVGPVLKVSVNGRLVSARAGDSLRVHGGKTVVKMMKAMV